MQEKVITISIAAYNKEGCIKDALDSLLIKDILDDIEVIVVDDGSKDNTYNIAKQYEDKYPDTFKVIHKDNAGYGSTVNYSIKNANGKYFKLLDGDDSFDSNGFRELVLLLKNIDADVIFTMFDKCCSDKVIRQKLYDKKFIDKIIDSNDFLCDEGYPMHTLTYKTSVLRESKVVLKESVLYSDNYYVSIPFSKVRSVLFKNIVVYKYNIGQEGQTISKESLITHSKDLYDIVFDLIDYYNKNKDDNIYCKDYIKNRIASTCVDYFVVLMKKDVNDVTLKEIIDYDQKIYNVLKDIYYAMNNINRKASRVLKLLRISKYSFYYILSHFCKKVL